MSVTRRTSLGLAAAAALFVASFAGSIVPAASAAALPVLGAPVDSVAPDATDQIIVRLVDGSTPNVAELSRVAGERVGLKRSMRRGAWVTKLGGRRSVADATAIAARIAALPGVAYAEPDRILLPTFTPPNSLWSLQWNLMAPTDASFGADLSAAWDFTRGSSDVVVAVIDTGITGHSDLAGQTVPGYDFISDATRANDGNGRDADPSDAGDWITTAENAAGVFAGCHVSDSSWHGTFVSSEIGALHDAVGVAGIAPDAKILPVRVLGKCGGFSSDIADGVRWAAGLAVAGVPTNPNPASVLNLSLGGAGACGITMQQAVSDVNAVGASVVVAAGNSNVNVSGIFPANCTGVVAVAATARTGSRASYSNFGTGVAIAAQGGDGAVAADWIPGASNTGATTPVAGVAGDGYVYSIGTSMAAPHVAGVAALMKSVAPAITPALTTSLLQSNVTAFPAGSTCTTSLCGTGILNAAPAVGAALAAFGPRVYGAFSKTGPAPGAIDQSRSLTLQWTAASGATGYEVCVVAGLSTPCATWTNVGNVTSVPVTGLRGSTLYAWQVRATNGTAVKAEANVSLRSTFTTVPAVQPGSPAITSAAPGNASVLLAWSPPADDGGSAVTDYTIRYTSNGGGSWTTFSHVASTATSRSVTGLSNGTAYRFEVATVTAVGTSSFSAMSSAVTPSGLAGQPTGVTGTFGNGQVGLTWTAPVDNGGSTVTDYVVQFTDDGGLSWSTFADGTSTTTSTTVTGLANGTAYRFKVAAVTVEGTGAFSAVSAAYTPATLPGQPTAVTGVQGDTKVNLTWAAPGNNGGRAVSDYVVQFSSNGGSSWSTFVDGVSGFAAATVTGLTPGLTYTFQVAAVNAVGTGAFSAPSSGVLAVTVPDAPTAVVGVPGDSSVSLTWSAPVGDGGSAVTDYVVRWSSTGGASWTVFADGAGTATAATVTGLTNGVQYLFTLDAANAVGHSVPSSPSAGVTPRTAPSAPEAPTGAPGNGQITLAWSAPGDGGSVITDHVVEYTIDDGLHWVTVADGVGAGTGATVAGLANGVAYRFHVAAVNAAGQGAFGAMSAAVTPRTVPVKPVLPKAVSGNTAVSLSWAAPSNGGAAITDHRVQYSADGGVTWKVFADGVRTATTAKVTGLLNGRRYLFRVAAVNIAGVGPYSSAVASTPSTVPSAPSRPTVSSASGVVTLKWAAPSNGGSAITDYAVQYSSNGGSTWSTYADGVRATTGATLTGLRRGVTYVYRVAAVNAKGRGTFSPASLATRLA